jgi:cation diffusion facilitator family transporter
MTHFPAPIKVPASVQRKRKIRQREIVRSAVFGIVIRLCIVAFEFIGVVYFGSAALMLDAIASLVDAASSAFLILCIKLAARPPDKEHPFGHGRYEPLIGLLLGLMLACVGVGLFIHQMLHLALEKEVTPINNMAWIIPLIALLLLEICYQIVMRTAKKQQSPALAADAIHYRIDSITSLFATIALLLAAYFPMWSLTFDHLGAIFIAVLMVGLGLYAARGNLNQLLDRIPENRFFDLVREAAKRVEGVQETEKIRIQRYGPDAHVDIDVEVDPSLTVEVAHGISQKVRVEIQKAWPAVRDVTVHIEPYYSGDH